MQIALVPREGIEKILPHVLPMLARALPFTRGRYDLDDVIQEIRAQDKLLWVIFDPGRSDGMIFGIILTIEGKYPALSVLRIELLAGEGMRDWILMAQSTLFEYAASKGLQRLEMTGRMGWLPTLEKLGWEMVYVTLEKEVPHVVQQRVDATDRAKRDAKHVAQQPAATVQ